MRVPEPRLSLGLLIFGAILPDILFVSPFEFYDYPYSHSALGAVILAIAGFLVYWLWPKGERKQRKRSAFVLAAAIFSHFILDVISHTPDMTIFGNNSIKLGLSLWNSLAGTMIVELGLLLLGIILYMSATVVFHHQENMDLP